MIVIVVKDEYMAGKFYAVKVGKTPGIYTTWDECKDNVNGFPGAIYKSFKTREDAVEFIGDKIILAVEEVKTSYYESDMPYAFVDGSYNIATGTYGYGGFLVCNNEKYILMGSGNDPEMASMRNVAGEVLGSQAAMAKALELGLKELKIYYDYAGIEMWALGNWKRNKKGTIAYYDFVNSIRHNLALYFVKVKGHSGVDGNEEADRLAKKAVGIE